MTAREMPDEGKFWARVDRTAECWLWTGSMTKNGYGNLRMPDGRNSYAHRVAYELTVGPIPEGLVIDHLCRTRACVNPEHLEAVPQRVNNERGIAQYRSGLRQTCKHGHDMTDPANVYLDPRGGVRCIICSRDANDRRRLARQAAKAAKS